MKNSDSLIIVQNIVTHTQGSKANTKIHIFPKLLEHLISHPLHSKELAKSYTMKLITIFINKF